MLPFRGGPQPVILKKNFIARWGVQQRSVIHSFKILLPRSCQPLEHQENKLYSTIRKQVQEIKHVSSSPNHTAFSRVHPSISNSLHFTNCAFASLFIGSSAWAKNPSHLLNVTLPWKSGSKISKGLAHEKRKSSFQSKSEKCFKKSLEGQLQQVPGVRVCCSKMFQSNLAESWSRKSLAAEKRLSGKVRLCSSWVHSSPPYTPQHDSKSYKFSFSVRLLRWGWSF